ncbi:D-arabinono-1,4-lactone oxidase [Cohnella thailandensis]|uniref:FAD-binding protein n=1 Tax=Cohnella thailandensis TaxID=557557 RepID=A0A841SS39_9BACL|nr:D-arabinono-1,4-lactone oxidase [Cohnella thailandensis]MBB6635183.1 FAD-binding protein [Cohnella thailandensis]MBP1974351.1 FAD-linked oxidoreductase [Cohnella thailandensis]
MSTQTQRWSNWSGSAVANPTQVLYPTSAEEIASIVRSCRKEGRSLRVVGSGHSFTPVAATNDILISLDRLQGIVSADADSRTATVWAGTKLKLLGELLHGEGLAQENLGDIDVQSIAGAVSTGTHGTGAGFGNISTQVIGMTIVDGNGDIREVDAESSPDTFGAFPVSLGVLGIIVQMKLRLRPAYKLEYRSSRIPLAECLERLDEYRNGHRHFEFYWFPYAETCQLKFMDESEDKITSRPVRDYLSEMVIENGVFGAMSGLCRRFPRLTRTVSRISASNVPVFRKVEYSHRIFATKRLVRFNEMEYNLPASAMANVVREMREVMERGKYAVHFPIECRYAKGDDLWLSPATGRDSAYIAVHMYKGMPYQPYFAAMEEIFLRHGGRPHWGKLHTLSESQLRERYPRWTDFLDLRSRMDPAGLFLNEHLKKLFVPSAE